MVNFRGLGFLLVSAATAGCTPSSPPAETPTPDPAVSPEDPAPATARIADGALTPFVATLEIDAEPGGKRFQGVWLIDAEGKRQVISYRADDWWRPFEGRRVAGTGEAYRPRGQAIRADHFRVHELRVIDPTPEDPLVSISGEREFEGTFTTHTGEPGSKSEGETSTVFVTNDGVAHPLHHVPDPAPALDEKVWITVRKVERSPYVASVGGPHFWVIEVRPPGETRQAPGPAAREPRRLD